MIEVEVLRAVALSAAGVRKEAVEALAHAVELAEADGWVRVFVDAGPALTEPLRQLAKREAHSGFVRALLEATQVAGDVVPDPGAVGVNERSWSTR